MNFSKTLCALVISLPVFSMAAENSTHDYTPKQLEQLKAISGKYTNSKKEQLDIIFKAVEDKQGDLFGPIEFRFEGDASFVNPSAGVYFEADSIVEITADSVVFEINNNDCDDPGCTTYESKMTIKKNQKGKFEAFFSGLFVSDTEDIAYQANQQGLEGAELEAFAEKECKSYYGPTARLLDTNGSVFCEYEVNTVLSQK